MTPDEIKAFLGIADHPGELLPEIVNAMRDTPNPPALDDKAILRAFSDFLSSGVRPGRVIRAREEVDTQSSGIAPQP